MAGNTEILIKRSLVTDKPTSVLQGELAYSYSSNTLFIGTPTGDGSIEIGAWSDLSGLTPGYYGDATHIPTIHVDQHGKVISVSNNEISTTMNFNDGLGGTGSINLLTGSLEFTGIDGITTAASGNTLTIGVDNTIVRANTMGNQTIDGVLNISGDLNVTGNTTSTDVVTIVSQNSLIFLANNNIFSDVIDIGFVGQANNGTEIIYTGLFRHAGDAGKDYYLFDGYTTNPDGTFVIDPFTNGFTLSTLHANINGNVNAQTVTSNVFLAAEGDPDGSGNAGYSFQNDGGYDTGMFSNGDGDVSLWSNDVKILSGYRENGLTLENGTKIIENNNSLAIGRRVGLSGYTQSIAIGYETNNDGGQQWQAIAIGPYTGYSNQGGSSVAIGARAAQYNQGSDAVAIGRHAGDSYQGNYGVAIGYYAGQTNQSQGGVAVGDQAGYEYQGTDTVAVGTGAGYSNQGWSAVAVGKHAGEYTQGAVATAVGPSAGEQSQGQGATALGRMAGYYQQGQDAVALGHYAGQYYQGTNSVAVGNYAGQNNQAENSIILNASGLELTTANSGFYVAPIRNIETSNIVFYNVETSEVSYGSMRDLRPDAITNGSYTWAVDGTTGALFSDAGTYIGDNANSVVLGQNVDLNNSNNNRVAIGNSAGNTNQGYGTVAVGSGAGAGNQSWFSVAVGLNAAQYNQNNSSVAIGHAAAENNQGSDAVAIGVVAGKYDQSPEAVAIGNRAGYGQFRNQGYGAVAIGSYTAFYGQDQYSVAIGYEASQDYSGQGSIAIGDRAGQNGLSQDSIAIGTYAQRNPSGWAPIAIGRYAGEYNQGSQSVAIGSQAGNNGLGYHSVALGHYAANSGSGERTVHIGDEAGLNTPAQGAVGIGYYAGYGAGEYSVALGYGAGWGDGGSLGNYQVAIGYQASAGGGQDHSIVLNASGDYFDAIASGLFIRPVRYTETQDATDDGLMFYNQTTGEVRYSYLLDGGAF